MHSSATGYFSLLRMCDLFQLGSRQARTSRRNKNDCVHGQAWRAQVGGRVAMFVSENPCHQSGRSSKQTHKKADATTRARRSARSFIFHYFGTTAESHPGSKKAVSKGTNTATTSMITLMQQCQVMTYVLVLEMTGSERSALRPQHSIAAWPVPLFRQPPRLPSAPPRKPPTLLKPRALDCLFLRLRTVGSLVTCRADCRAVWGGAGGVRAGRGVTLQPLIPGSIKP